jgi:hypothetical protein
MGSPLLSPRSPSLLMGLVDCTYDQPSNRRRNPAPQYIEALENRLQRAEALLRTFIPNIDLNDPKFDSLANSGTTRSASAAASSTPVTTPATVKLEVPQDDAQKDAHIQSMIQTTGQLDLDDRGHWDFHGGSSGTIFLNRMREQFGGLLGNDTTIPFPKVPRSTYTSPGMFDSPVGESPMETGLPNTMDLPSKEIARSLSTNALKCACALLRFVHQPTFDEMFDRIYDTPVETYGDEENRFLPLLYTILAVGCMFTPGDLSGQEKTSYKSGIDQGQVFMIQL